LADITIDCVKGEVVQIVQISQHLVFSLEPTDELALASG
jgi:hypothetical protein